MIRNYLRHLGAFGGVAIAIAAMGLPASAQTIMAPPVPTNIQVPAENTAFLGFVRPIAAFFRCSSPLQL